MPNALLLCILNSSTLWWYMNDHMPHMKDEAFGMVSTKVGELPIPKSEKLLELEPYGDRLLALSARSRDFVDLFVLRLHDELGIGKPGKKLISFWAMSEVEIMDEIRKRRGRFSSNRARAKFIKALSESRATMIDLRSTIARMEIELHHKVFNLYGLNDREVALMRRNAPPRCPLTLAEQELEQLEGLR